MTESKRKGGAISVDMSDALERPCALVIPEVERKGLTIHVDGVPTLQLNSWVMTRPQDWAPQARAILFRAAAEPSNRVTGSLRSR